MLLQNLGEPKFYANSIEVNGNLWILWYFLREVCSCVAIPWNFKMRLDPVWTNSIGIVTQPLLFLYSPRAFKYLASTQVYTFLGETVAVFLHADKYYTYTASKTWTGHFERTMPWTDIDPTAAGYLTSPSWHTFKELWVIHIVHNDFLFHRPNIIYFIIPQASIYTQIEAVHFIVTVSSTSRNIDIAYTLKER